MSLIENIDRDDDEGLKKIITSYNFERWKKASDELYSPDDALTVWRGVKETQPHLSPEKDLTFVSPSANYPTHEARLFVDEREARTGKVHFITGDYAEIDASELLRELEGLQDDRCQFEFRKWDAANLPLELGSTDVLWDRRGWLWHLANTVGSLSIRHLYAIETDSMEQDKLNNDLRIFKIRRKIRESMLKYRALLKEGGVLILDSDPGKKIGFEEDSSEAEIQKAFVDLKMNFWQSDWLKKLFDVEYVGEGKHRVLVLKKKTELK